jgi:hypothetical protein
LKVFFQTGFIKWNSSLSVDNFLPDRLDLSGDFPRKGGKGGGGSTEQTGRLDDKSLTWSTYYSYDLKYLNIYSFLEKLN